MGFKKHLKYNLCYLVLRPIYCRRKQSRFDYNEIPIHVCVILTVWFHLALSAWNSESAWLVTNYATCYVWKVMNLSAPLFRTLFGFRNFILRIPCQRSYPTYSHYTTLCETWCWRKWCYSGFGYKEKSDIPLMRLHVYINKILSPTVVRFSYVLFLATCSEQFYIENISRHSYNP